MKAWMGTICVCCLVLAAASDPARGQTVPGSLTVSPASLDFGELEVGTQGQPMTVTINNQGNATVVLEDVLLSGMDFSETTDCGKSLAPGAACTMQIMFKPVIPGQRIGNVDITALDSGSPHFVALVGIGK